MVQLMSLGFCFDNLLVYLFSFIVYQDSGSMTASVYAGRERVVYAGWLSQEERKPAHKSMCNAQGLDRQDPICISIYKRNPFTPQETW